MTSPITQARNSGALLTFVSTAAAVMAVACGSSGKTTLATGRLPLLWGRCARADKLAATPGLFSR